jgi:hypothetical protein
MKGYLEMLIQIVQEGSFQMYFDQSINERRNLYQKGEDITPES